jgi:hypothetical protein
MHIDTTEWGEEVQAVGERLLDLAQKVVDLSISVVTDTERRRKETV